ncbi:hypothetical protein ACA910_001813 [Epithemia clementina (nom. ined.)]
MASTPKTVLITGGNRGLGKALVDCFASTPDWRVLATARDKDSLPTGIAGRYSLDLSKHESVVSLAQELSSGEEAQNKIDLIIHNAGFNPKDNKTVKGYFESTFSCNKGFSAANVAESMMINALHPMELTGRLRSQLAEDAVVLAISSWLGSIGGKTVPGHYGYTGSKALMNMCMKGLSLEFAKAGEKRVAIALNPGWMKTDMGGSSADISPEEVAKRIYGMFTDGFFHQSNGKFLNTDRSEHEWLPWSMCF